DLPARFFLPKFLRDIARKVSDNNIPLGGASSSPSRSSAPYAHHRLFWGEQSESNSLQVVTRRAAARFRVGRDRSDIPVSGIDAEH
ncbi:MAG: hypothetical protein ACRD3J_02705, partial [Thermoanaerobaculia bacterium]